MMLTAILTAIYILVTAMTLIFTYDRSEGSIMSIIAVYIAIRIIEAIIVEVFANRLDNSE